MAVDLSPAFAVLVFLLTLVFTVSPVRKFGLLNLLFGCFGMLVGSLTVAGLPAVLPFHPYFSVLMSLMGVMCLWRGLKARGLND